MEPSGRLVRDCITFCSGKMKRYNPVNISGYHISEAGASPLHEAAFTLANGITYVEEVLKTYPDYDRRAIRRRAQEKYDYHQVAARIYEMYKTVLKV